MVGRRSRLDAAAWRHPHRLRSSLAAPAPGRASALGGEITAVQGASSVDAHRPTGPTLRGSNTELDSFEGHGRVAASGSLPSDFSTSSAPLRSGGAVTKHHPAMFAHGHTWPSQAQRRPRPVCRRSSRPGRRELWPHLSPVVTQEAVTQGPEQRRGPTDTGVSGGRANRGRSTAVAGAHRRRRTGKSPRNRRRG